mmetsp:Transcript_23686/g.25302  ORF Transcript_23686/g.25302 Transcript_23686/m.25302 type:complete len:84 (-) Transcript_23686:185-436(-)
MKAFNLLLASAAYLVSSTEGFAPVRNNNRNNKSPNTTTTTLRAEIGDTGVVFENVAREWRCKYSPGPSGTSDDSDSLRHVNHY